MHSVTAAVFMTLSGPPASSCPWHRVPNETGSWTLSQGRAHDTGLGSEDLFLPLSPKVGGAHVVTVLGTSTLGFPW